MKNNNILIAVALIAAGIVGRTMAANFYSLVPIFSVALFSGFYFKNKAAAIAIPLLTMLLGDVYLEVTANQGFYGASQILNYIGFVAITLIGGLIKQPKVANVGLSSIAGSAAFFIISNFGTWADTAYNLYPKTTQGLLNCYINGLPFLKTDVISGLVYNVIIFGIFKILIQAKSTKTVTLSN